MADMGEKIYITKEATLQSILTKSSNIATKENLTSVVDDISTPIFSGFENLKRGTAPAGSQTEVTITGTGILTISFNIMTRGSSNYKWWVYDLDGNAIMHSHSSQNMNVTPYEKGRTIPFVGGIKITFAGSTYIAQFN